MEEQPDARRDEAHPGVVGQDHSRAGVVVCSPMRDEDGQEKNQDRAEWFSDEQIGCVCDGLTTSPYADEAADAVINGIGSARASWLDGGLESLRRVLDGLAQDLLRRRAEAGERPIKVDKRYSDQMRTTLDAVVREKRLSSHRTTVISIRLLPSSNGTMRVRCLKCGDSELLAFSPSGTLLWATAELRWAESEAAQGAPPEGRTSPGPKRQMLFDRRSNITDMLPDTWMTTVLWATEFVLPEDACVLITSDGLIDAFERPTDLFTWLQMHRQDLATDSAKAELHDLLKRRRGDDDISFVWLPSSSFIKETRGGFDADRT